MRVTFGREGSTYLPAWAGLCWVCNAGAVCTGNIFKAQPLVFFFFTAEKGQVFVTACCSFYSKFCSPSGHSHLLEIINYLLSGWSQGLCSGHLEKEVEAEMAALSIET